MNENDRPITRGEYETHARDSQARDRDLASRLSSHATKSDERNRDLDARLADLKKAVDDSAFALTEELINLRRDLRIVATDRAMMRTPSTRAPAPALDATVTQNRARMTVDAASAFDTIESAGSSIAHMGIWRARPSLVVGFIGSLLALAVSFGLPLTHEQRTAILAVIPIGLAVVASMRGEKTKTALVKAALVKGSTLAPPDSRE